MHTVCMGIESLLLLFASETLTNHLPPKLIDAVCYTESHYDVKAINPDDGRSSSIGLCQCKLSTAYLMGFRGTEAQLLDPRVNAHYAARYLRYQLSRYSGDVHLAVAAYNSGTARVNEDGTVKNKDYVNKVFKSWREKQVAHPERCNLDHVCSVKSPSPRNLK